MGRFPNPPSTHNGLRDQPAHPRYETIDSANTRSAATHPLSSIPPALPTRPAPEPPTDHRHRRMHADLLHGTPQNLRRQPSDRTIRLKGAGFVAFPVPCETRGLDGLLSGTLSLLQARVARVCMLPRQLRLNRRHLGGQSGGGGGVCGTGGGPLTGGTWHGGGLQAMCRGEGQTVCGWPSSRVGDLDGGLDEYYRL